MTVQNFPGGRPIVILGTDGTNLYGVTTDADGHLQIDVLSTPAPTGGATSANQTTMITALQLIDDLRNALGSVDTDDLQVDVKTSALPSGAATAANQTTMITALQLIDDLRNALDSVGTDELDVNVEESVLPTGAATETTLDAIKTAAEIIDGFADEDNVLFGYNDRWVETEDQTLSADGNFVASTTAVPAGEIHILQAAYIRNDSGARGRAHIRLTDGTNYTEVANNVTPVQYESVLFLGPCVLKEGDYVYFLQVSGLSGDTIRASAWGYKMKI